uniref:HTH arsR-type domain-containing protein n=1 Tax=Haemonchus placei TaxID=6290 RepID=A0A0N4W6S5_HAEPC
MPRSGRPATVDRQGILNALGDEPTSSLRDLSKVTQVPVSPSTKSLLILARCRRSVELSLTTSRWHRQGSGLRRSRSCRLVPETCKSVVALGQRAPPQSEGYPGRLGQAGHQDGHASTV